MKKLLSAIIISLQVACGFRPVYKEVRSTMAAIEIKQFDSIEGTYFYNHLRTIFPPQQGEVGYILDVKLSFSRSYDIIEPNSDILRETANIHVTYKLTEKASSKIIAEGSFNKMNSYSVNVPLYSNTIARQEAMNILAQNAAEEVRNRLIMFFTIN